MEKLEGTERTIRIVMDASFTQYRIKRESFWIRQLRTTSSYEWNVDLGDDVRKYSKFMADRHFPFLNKTRCRQCKGIKQSTKSDK